MSPSPDAYRVRGEPAEVKRRAVETVEAGEAPTLAGAVNTRSGERPDRNSADYFAAAGAEAAKTATAIEAMVRAWAAPTWALCDPFCGAGTILAAARRAGQHVGGADAGNVALARARRDSCRKGSVAIPVALTSRRPGRERAGQPTSRTR